MPSDATTSTHAIPPDVLALLLLPPFDALTADQARGAVCVWGTEQLTTETAVDLGEKTGPEGRWWPRACPRHTADRAHRGLFNHAAMCEQCTDAAEHCDISRALYRLVRDGRR
ncbi:hypothetical protein [Streptomyces sp. NPDC058812]|uniref:hypothetical protein n=1 Tax=unclassified Streptomyces TaxID=2593676 RepID=UPI0036C22C14